VVHLFCIVAVEQALGGDITDRWTQQHYQVYLKKAAEFQAWVDQHLVGDCV